MSTKTRITQGISFEPDLLPAAKARAAVKRQSLSAYINSLLVADLGCELFATLDQQIPPEEEKKAA
jgi:hypothetical protein